MLRGLYLITPSPFNAGLLTACQVALRTGIGALQFRGKGLTWQQSLDFGHALKALCHQHQTPLIINDNIALCQALDADGVHLGQNDGSVPAARAVLGGKWLGVTCHNDLSLAHTAIEEGADYVAFGRFFDSNTKPEAPPCHLDVLSAAKKSFSTHKSVPIVAIGGINPDNGHLALKAGADVLAVIDAVFGQRDIAKAVAQLNALFISSASR